MTILKNLTTIITGGAGGIGKIITKKALDEGARVVITGRDPHTLQNYQNELITLNPEFSGRIHWVIMDGCNLTSIIKGIEEIHNRFGKIDILINNAGSAGPMCLLSEIPLTKEELQGTHHSESLDDALKAIFGFPWMLICGFYPYFNKGASIINVSSIFSKYPYFGRAAYTVAKAALNELSDLMAEECAHDERLIRVNTVYPGPVESERIHHVFSIMDKLKGDPEGSLEKELSAHFVTKNDVANAIVFLGSPESRAFTHHHIEVTRGLQIDQEDTIEVYHEPNPKIVDLDGHYTWIIGGMNKEDAYTLAEKHYNKGSAILLTFRDPETLEESKIKYHNKCNFDLKHFDPSNPDDWKKVQQNFCETFHFPSTIFLLPYHSPKKYEVEYGKNVLHIPLEKIQDYIRSEIEEAIIAGKFLSRLSHSAHQTNHKVPMIVFVSNCSNQKEKSFEKIRTAAIEQLIRVWRYENDYANKGVKGSQQKICQMIRFKNGQPENLDITANIAISLSSGITSVPHINIQISKVTAHPDLKNSYNQKYHQILENLDGKVALLTGGSEGIGKETTRLLVQGGATVIIASRNQDKLLKTKKQISDELFANGFPESENRIGIAVLDVSNKANIKNAFEEIIGKYGRIDFLINNAGISGEEKMVVDMSPEGWRKTLQSNLLSNYDLIVLALPFMKDQKKGYITNISSAFGGMHFATPSYPLRADYAVTKAGQRALVEEFASILGPEIKINTIAPGPVEGDRLKGDEKHPGLYYRRAKINAEYKRINSLYDALIDTWRLTGDISNDTVNKILANKLNKNLATRLIKRLQNGGYLSKNFSEDIFLKTFIESKEDPTLSQEYQIRASELAVRTIATLALNCMPTEYDVGREIAFNLSSRCTTGQTIYPSSGVSFNQLAIQGDFTGTFHPSLFDYLDIPLVVIIGGSMQETMLTVAKAYLKGKNVKKIVILTSLDISPLKNVHIQKTASENIENSLNEVINNFGRPQVIISFPFSQLPPNEGGWEKLPSIEAFRDLIESHLTNHFLVGKRGALIDDCRIFFVTAPAFGKNSSIESALSLFIGTTLAPLTCTIGQEASRLCHKARFLQINGQAHQKEEDYQNGLLNALLLNSLPESTSTLKIGQVTRV